MQSFDFYPQAWAIYIGLGIVLLFVIDWKLKKSSFKLRAGFLSLIAVGAFTPLTVNNSDALAPLILTSLFNAEVDGMSAIYQGLITLLIIWGIVFSAALAIRHFMFAKQAKNKE